MTAQHSGSGACHDVPIMDALLSAIGGLDEDAEETEEAEDSGLECSSEASKSDTDRDADTALPSESTMSDSPPTPEEHKLAYALPPPLITFPHHPAPPSQCSASSKVSFSFDPYNLLNPMRFHGDQMDFSSPGIVQMHTSPEDSILTGEWASPPELSSGSSNSAQYLSDYQEPCFMRMDTREDTPPMIATVRFRVLPSAVYACFVEGVEVGQHVVVEGDRGHGLGVVDSLSEPDSIEAALSLPRVVRLALDHEVAYLSVLRAEEEEAKEIAVSILNQRELKMAITDAEYQFDKKKITFLYTCKARLDFRQLLKDLYSRFKCRVWMERTVTTPTKPSTPTTVKYPSAPHTPEHTPTLLAC